MYTIYLLLGILGLSILLGLAAACCVGITKENIEKVQLEAKKDAMFKKHIEEGKWDDKEYNIAVREINNRIKELDSKIGEQDHTFAGIVVFACTIVIAISIILLIIFGITAGVHNNQRLNEENYQRMNYEYETIMNLQRDNGAFKLENQEYIISKIERYNNEIIKTRIYKDSKWANIFVYDKVAECRLIGE